MDVLENIQSLLRDILDNEELVITEKTVAADVEGWDSFAQMQIIMGIEGTYGISFSTDEVTEFKNVGDIVVAVKKHLIKDNC